MMNFHLSLPSRSVGKVSARLPVAAGNVTVSLGMEILRQLLHVLKPQSLLLQQVAIPTLKDSEWCP